MRAFCIVALLLGITNAANVKVDGQKAEMAFSDAANQQCMLGMVDVSGTPKLSSSCEFTSPTEQRMLALIESLRTEVDLLKGQIAALLPPPPSPPPPTHSPPPRARHHRHHTSHCRIQRVSPRTASTPLAFPAVPQGSQSKCGAVVELGGIITKLPVVAGPMLRGR